MKWPRTWEREVPCELLPPIAHPLGRELRKILWDTGDLGDVTVPVHQQAENVYQRGERPRLRAWSDDETNDYKVRLPAFQGAHAFVAGGGGEEDEEEEREEDEEAEAEEDEGEEREAPEDGDADLSILPDIDSAPRRPAPLLKPSPKGAGPFHARKQRSTNAVPCLPVLSWMAPPEPPTMATPPPADTSRQGCRWPET